mmetsp:Transcript_47891/g.133502  ORF Transcript_47891/g.133502 Transcript_47891/m.133502 type:complete len:232 (-) Transcript_47891:1004-1699(-)
MCGNVEGVAAPPPFELANLVRICGCGAGGQPGTSLPGGVFDHACVLKRESCRSAVRESQKLAETEGFHNKSPQQPHDPQQQQHVLQSHLSARPDKQPLFRASTKANADAAQQPKAAPPTNAKLLYASSLSRMPFSAESMVLASAVPELVSFACGEAAYCSEEYTNASCVVCAEPVAVIAAVEVSSPDGSSVTTVTEGVDVEVVLVLVVVEVVIDVVVTVVRVGHEATWPTQ